jgi:hypothetical protein
MRSSCARERDPTGTLRRRVRTRREIFEKSVWSCRVLVDFVPYIVRGALSRLQRSPIASYDMGASLRGRRFVVSPTCYPRPYDTHVLFSIGRDPAPCVAIDPSSLPAWSYGHRSATLTDDTRRDDTRICVCRRDCIEIRRMASITRRTKLRGKTSPIEKLSPHTLMPRSHIAQTSYSCGFASIIV